MGVPPNESASAQECDSKLPGTLPMLVCCQRLKPKPLSVTSAPAPVPCRGPENCSMCLCCTVPVWGSRAHTNSPLAEEAVAGTKRDRDLFRSCSLCPKGCTTIPALAVPWEPRWRRLHPLTARSSFI